MLFMRYAIDVLFLDQQNVVVAAYSHLRPWIGLTRWHGDARSALELPAGTIRQHGLAPGDGIRLTAGSLHDRPQPRNQS
ncbi:MAG: hypothetical protein OZSIB_3843 [Candidatus Ozemobacter sibiricus]|uniref:DUF192 domain-containing protein n=1 Tax=Candidatus Ozemobacter sibiricus TaxID=2268124 RepID=A0A367ZPA8_9BACT|nr:MAG: hypothetical protein OZSIB_3843 [Candidatus Ozemobacter sibiricus]